MTNQRPKKIRTRARSGSLGLNCNVAGDGISRSGECSYVSFNIDVPVGYSGCRSRLLNLSSEMEIRDEC